MAFLFRIGNSKLKTAFFNFPRCYTHLLPHSPLPNSIPKPIPIVTPYSHSPILFNTLRFFAVPVQFQVKPKNEDDDDIDGPRLNDQIKAKYVRLVADDGHSIVSRFEALDRARKLKLDLVEVDKNANPPVVKIMDHHKELFKKKESDKERAKSKSVMTMKNECKEVRFSEKTESKDLKMKADMVKKLMDKGYRVKVKATGTADQAMLDSISRISALMEDVCVVESGPHLTRKEAYMIVRHLKYGPPKKSSKKSKDAVHTDEKANEGDVEPLTSNPSDSIEYVNKNSPEQEAVLSDPPVLENRYKKPNSSVENKVQSNAQVPPTVPENRYKKAEPRNTFQSNAQVPPAVPENRYAQVPPAVPENRYAQVPPAVPENRYAQVPPAVPENRYAQVPPAVSENRYAQVPPSVPENRYKKAEPRNRFQQTTSNTNPGTRDANRWTPLNLNRTRNVPVDNSNFNPRIDNPPVSRNSMPPRDDINNRPPRGPNTTSPGYGHFSNIPRGPQP